MRNRVTSTESKSKYNIKKIDFANFKQIQAGANNIITNNEKKVRFKWAFYFFLSGSFIKFIFLLTNKIIKIYSIRFKKIKKGISRRIFFGRGVYFKLFYNISTVFIIFLSSAIYLSTDTSGQDSEFVSKYSGEEIESNVLYASSSGETAKTTVRLAPINYTVQEGDTLSTIAENFSKDNNRVSVDAIKWANGLESSTDIKPGQKLIIPPIQGTIHKIEDNETLESIAILHNKLTPEQIEAAKNGDTNAQIIYNGFKQEIVDANLLAIKVDGNDRIPQIASGQLLIIPNGSIDVPDPTPPPPTPEPYNPPAYASRPINNNISVVPAEPIGNAGFIWPVAGGRGIISQYYSPWHTAVDIADASGPALLAVASGTVITTGWEAYGCGFVVRIQHDNGYVTTNCHTQGDSLQVSVGQRVVQGQVLAYMGCSGICTGTHVHFMVKTPSGAVVDPLGYIFR